MSTTKEYLMYILEQLSDLEEITYRMMMGEYIIYYRKKIVGGIYDNRFLIKPVEAAVQLMPEASYEIPYKGAKPMLMVSDDYDKSFMKKLLTSMYDELPAPKAKKKK